MSNPVVPIRDRLIPFDVIDPSLLNRLYQQIRLPFPVNMIEYQNFQTEKKEVFINFDGDKNFSQFFPNE